jgi:hypothetical protein
MRRLPLCHAVCVAEGGRKAPYPVFTELTWPQGAFHNDPRFTSFISPAPGCTAVVQVALLMYHVMVVLAHREQYRSVVTVGYSGVLFGWMAIISVKNPGATLPCQSPLSP